MNRFIDESSNKDGEGYYTDLPVEIDWERPSAEHFERTYHRQDWISKGSDEVGSHVWAIKDGVLYWDWQCTDGTVDWASNLWYFPEDFKECETCGFRDSTVKVHAGMYNEYLAYRNELLDLVYRDDIHTVRITGYSLGAYLTALSVYDLMWHFSKFDKHGKVESCTKNILGIGYEGGRVFCYNRLVKNLCKNNLIMVKNHCDPVIHVPFMFMRFIPFVKIHFFPFFIRFTNDLGFSLWMDVGKKDWIGKIWRLLPIQHIPEQVIRSLKEKYGY